MAQDVYVKFNGWSPVDIFGEIRQFSDGPSLEELTLGVCSKDFEKKILPEIKHTKLGKPETKFSDWSPASLFCNNFELCENSDKDYIINKGSVVGSQKEGARFFKKHEVKPCIEATDLEDSWELPPTGMTTRTCSQESTNGNHSPTTSGFQPMPMFLKSVSANRLESSVDCAPKEQANLAEETIWLKHESAQIIQRNWRSHLSRQQGQCFFPSQQVHTLKRNKSCTVIQRWFRNWRNKPFQNGNVFFSDNCSADEKVNQSDSTTQLILSSENYSKPYNQPHFDFLTPSASRRTRARIHRISTQQEEMPNVDAGQILKQRISQLRNQQICREQRLREMDASICIQNFFRRHFNFVHSRNSFSEEFSEYWLSEKPRKESAGAPKPNQSPNGKIKEYGSEPKAEKTMIPRKESTGASKSNQPPKEKILEYGSEPKVEKPTIPSQQSTGSSKSNQPPKEKTKEYGSVPKAEKPMIPSQESIDASSLKQPHREKIEYGPEPSAEKAKIPRQESTGASRPNQPPREKIKEYESESKAETPMIPRQESTGTSRPNQPHREKIKEYRQRQESTGESRPNQPSTEKMKEYGSERKAETPMIKLKTDKRRVSMNQEQMEQDPQTVQNDKNEMLSRKLKSGKRRTSINQERMHQEPQTDRSDEDERQSRTSSFSLPAIKIHVNPTVNTSYWGQTPPATKCFEDLLLPEICLKKKPPPPPPRRPRDDFSKARFSKRPV